VTEEVIYTDRVMIRAAVASEAKDGLIRKLIEATSDRVKITEDGEVYFGEAAGEKLVFD